MKIAMIMIIVMAVVLGGFYWYYQDSQKKLAVLQENNAKLEVSVQTQKETIEQHLEDFLDSLNSSIARLQRRPGQKKLFCG